MSELLPVIGLAHGSRHPEGSQAIESLMAEVSRQGGMPAYAAFLDLSEPHLTAVARSVAAAGHRAAVVVPLLFTQAFHATIDVPEAVQEAAAATGLSLRVSEVLGTGEDIEEVLLAAMADAGVGPGVASLLYAVGSSRRTANEAVAHLAQRIGARQGAPAAAAFGTCEPRLTAVLSGLGEPVAMVPLFLAEGLLLKPLRSVAQARGWPMVEPLGERAAAVVLHRYASATAGDHVHGR